MCIVFKKCKKGQFAPANELHAFCFTLDLAKHQVDPSKEDISCLRPGPQRYLVVALANTTQINFFFFVVINDASVIV